MPTYGRTVRDQEDGDPVAAASPDGGSRPVPDHRPRTAAGRTRDPSVTRAGVPAGDSATATPVDGHPRGAVRHPRLHPERPDRGGCRQRRGPQDRWRPFTGEAGARGPPHGHPPPRPVVTKPRIDQAAARAGVVDRIRQCLPGLSDQEAVSALDASSCNTTRSLMTLDRHLREHPQALLTASPHVPFALVRLAHALHSQGRHDVALPTCAGCGQAKPRMASVDGTGGRLCERCAHARVGERKCAWCGRLGRVEARRPEGGICGRCYQTDPSHHEPCAACGRTRRVTRRLPDGSGLCQACRPKLTYVCSGCGDTKPAHAIGREGPVCETCYRRPERPCGACGRTARIYHRATADTPDLCGRCYEGIEGPCTVCGRTRMCRRGRTTGDLVCRGCRPEPQRLCSFCNRIGSLRAIWPAGPACRGCYQAVRANPAPCADCSTTRVLIGQNPASDPICGPCAGVDTDYTCHTC